MAVDPDSTSRVFIERALVELEEQKRRFRERRQSWQRVSAEPAAAAPIVLLVEDDADLVGVLAMQLERAGFVVLAATTGGAAITACRKAQPAALVVDLDLPDTTGMQVIAALRAEGIEAPAVVMSGVVDEEELHRCAAECGARAALGKPFDGAGLVDVVRRLLA